MTMPYVTAALHAAIDGSEMLLDAETIAEADHKQTLTAALARDIIRRVVRLKPDGSLEINIGGFLRRMIESLETCGKDPNLLSMPDANELPIGITRTFLTQQIGTDDNYTGRVQPDHDIKRMLLAFTSADRVTPSNNASKTELKHLAHAAGFRSLARTWLAIRTTKEARQKNPFISIQDSIPFDVLTVPMMLLAVAMYRPPSPVAIQALTEGGLMPEVESGFAQILAMTSSIVNITRLMMRAALRGVINIFAAEEQRAHEAIRRSRKDDAVTTQAAAPMMSIKLSDRTHRADVSLKRCGVLNDKWQVRVQRREAPPQSGEESTNGGSRNTLSSTGTRRICELANGP
jgi:hypothetical protein